MRGFDAQADEHPGRAAFGRKVRVAAARATRISYAAVAAAGGAEPSGRTHRGLPRRAAGRRLLDSVKPMLGAIALGIALAITPEVADRLSIDLDAPSDCMDGNAVRAAIERYVGRDSFGPEVEDVEITISVRPRAASYLLAVDVTLPGGTVEREIVAASCPELVEAAGLMIAVALDPLRVATAVAPRVEPLQPKPGTPRETAAPPASKPAGPPAARPVRARPCDYLELGVGGGIEVGILRRVAGAARATVACTRSWLRIELAGGFSSPGRLRPFAERPEASIAIMAGGLGLRGCVALRIGPLEMPSCVGFEAGVVRGSGHGIATMRVSHRAWAAAVVGQGIAWFSRHRVGVFLQTEGVVTIVRPRFGVDGLGQGFAAGFAGFRLIAGPAVRL